MALASVLTACAVKPPVTESELASAARVPARWSVAGLDTTPTASWWQGFDDPLLAKLVDDAMQANTRIRTAQAALRQAIGLRDVAAAALRPVLGGSASASRGTADGESTGNRFQLGLDAGWVPDVFGARRAALDASLAAALASAATLGDVQVAIASEVGLNYIALRAAQVRLGIATRNLASQDETLQITRWREQAGLVTALEAEQASTAAEQTRALLPALRTSIALSGHALATLSGQAPAQLDATLAPPGTVPQARGAMVLRIPADTLRQRADVRAAEHQVSAALARVAQADAARYPSFSLSGNLGVDASTLGSLGQRTSVLGALLAATQLPLLDGGAARAQIRAQQAALAQARLAYQGVVLTALREVEDALAVLQGDQLRLQSLGKAAEAATRAADLANQRYRSGLVDFQVVLTTQRTQLVAQDSLATVRADIGNDHVRLFKALGGGWRDTSGTDAADRDMPPRAQALP